MHHPEGEIAWMAFVHRCARIAGALTGLAIGVTAGEVCDLDVFAWTAAGWAWARAAVSLAVGLASGVACSGAA